MIPSRMMRIWFARFALAILAALAVVPAWAEKQVIFSRLVDGPDFDEVMEFLGRYLKPEEYDTERSLKGTGGKWRLGKTLDLYLREFVKMGKGDIDDDGIEERFYFFEDPLRCGSSGCHIVVLQKQNGAWRLICEMSGSDHHVWITDWMSEGGRRELKARWGVYWRNGKCHDDDPKNMEEYGPELIPPRGERTWKPMR